MYEDVSWTDSRDKIILSIAIHAGCAQILYMNYVTKSCGVGVRAKNGETKIAGVIAVVRFHSLSYMFMR